MRLVAPRSLKEPVRWRFSALSSTCVPVQREIAPAESTGVGEITASMTVRARWMSSSLTTAAIVCYAADTQGQDAGQVIGVVTRLRMRPAHQQRLHARALRAGDVRLVGVADEEDLARARSPRPRSQRHTSSGCGFSTPRRADVSTSVSGGTRSCARQISGSSQT